MELENRAAELQSLKDAAKLSPSSPKEKLLLELTDTVSLLCHQVCGMDTVVDGLGQTLEELQDQLMDFSLEPQEDGLGVDEYFDGQERPLYEVKCPECGDRFAVDEASLVKGFSCPNCGTHLMQAE